MYLSPVMIVDPHIILFIFSYNPPFFVIVVPNPSAVLLGIEDSHTEEYIIACNVAIHVYS